MTLVPVCVCFTLTGTSSSTCYTSTYTRYITAVIAQYMVLLCLSNQTRSLSQAVTLIRQML